MVAFVVFIVFSIFEAFWSTTFYEKKASNLYYISLKKVTKTILEAGHYCIIIKKDIKDACQNILVVFHV